MANGKAMRPDELPAELLKNGLCYSSHEILFAFYGIIVAVWMTGEVPQEKKLATIRVLNKKKYLLLWEVLARFGVPPRMIKAIRIFHGGMRARVQLNHGDFPRRGSMFSRGSGKDVCCRCCSISSLRRS